MQTPHNPGDVPKPDVNVRDEMFIGELTAALAADARSSADALPASLAVLAVQSGEAFARARRQELADAEAGPSAVVPILRHPLHKVSTWGGWLAAAAVLAFWVASDRASGRLETSSETVAVVAGSPAALLDSLLVGDPALTRVAFTGTKDEAAVGAGGEVLWSATAQRGVMRLVGLAPNDRTRLQYQLWIFDRLRDQRYPVDGGVFDIPAGATEVLVPINARVPVGDATMFAVTVEPAGGVVVSSRERVALLAEL